MLSLNWLRLSSSMLTLKHHMLNICHPCEGGNDDNSSVKHVRGKTAPR